MQIIKISLGSDLQKALDNQLGSNKATVSDNGDGSFLISTASDNLYILKNSGEIEKSTNILTINTLSDLKNFSENVNNGFTYSGWYIILKNNLEFGSNDSFVSIGSISTPFNGTFNGNYKTISNLSIATSSNYQGLFGYNLGIIKNLTVSNSSISGDTFLGSITGYNGGIIENCSSISNTISTTTSDYNVFLGGIVGFNEGTINSCYSNLQINLNKFSISGICGKSENGTIKNCYSNSSITGYGEVSGIVGTSYSDSIYNCYNSGIIEASMSGAGGIVGISHGSNIYNCYNCGNLNSSNGGNIGGILGVSNSSSDTDTSVTNSYNISPISAYGTVGGIIGQSSNSLPVIKHCYNSGDVISSSNSINAGGIIGSISSTSSISDCIWSSTSVSFGIGYLSSNTGTVYSSSIQMPSILDIINSERKFKLSNNTVILNWQ